MSVHVSMHVFDESLTLDVGVAQSADGDYLFVRLVTSDGRVSIGLDADKVRDVAGVLAKAAADLRSIADKKDADRIFGASGPGPHQAGPAGPPR